MKDPNLVLIRPWVTEKSTILQTVSEKNPKYVFEIAMDANKIEVKNAEGKKVKTADLSSDVFGIEPNIPVTHQVVVCQAASMRQGTHSTKGRSDVSGGGAKPWRQKGTGRARQGTIRAAQWAGAAVFHAGRCRRRSWHTQRQRYPGGNRPSSPESDYSGRGRAAADGRFLCGTAAG